MKTLSYWILGFIFIALSFVLLKPSPKDEGFVAAVKQLPWDIQTNEYGGSRVFGIDLGQTTVNQALNLLGEDHDLAIISDQQDNAGLEIYYSHFRSGPFNAKLILSVDVNNLLLETMINRASNSEYIDSGARKFSLSPEDLSHIQEFTIKAITLVPSANLSEATIIDRFGEAAKVIQIDAQTTHFLYPGKGLDVALNKDAKEAFQYIAPIDFKILSDPLEAAASSEKVGNEKSGK